MMSLLDAMRNFESSLFNASTGALRKMRSAGQRMRSAGQRLAAQLVLA